MGYLDFIFGFAAPFVQAVLLALALRALCRELSAPRWLRAYGAGVMAIILAPLLTMAEAMLIIRDPFEAAVYGAMALFYGGICSLIGGLLVIIWETSKRFDE